VIGEVAEGDRRKEAEVAGRRVQRVREVEVVKARRLVRRRAASAPALRARQTNVNRTVCWRNRWRPQTIKANQPRVLFAVAVQSAREGTYADANYVQTSGSMSGDGSGGTAAEASAGRNGRRAKCQRVYAR